MSPPVAAKNKAVVKALVRGAGAARINDDDTKAVLLLFVDQLLITSHGTKPGTGQPKISWERVTVTMVNTKGRWLVDDIRPF